MSLQSTFTNASINGWRGLSDSNPYSLNAIIINDPPRPSSENFGWICAVSDNGEYFACTQFALGSNIWIFKNNFDGTYTQQATYAYTSSRVYSLSISDAGDYVVATAGGNVPYIAPAYVYTRSGSTWSLQQTITVAAVSFGSHSKISGDGTTLVIGGRNTSGATTTFQCIYIYTRSGSTWTLQQTINTIPLFNGNRIGAVTINYDGNYIAVTDPLANSGNGYLYIYYKASTTWALQQTITFSAYPNVNSNNVGLSLSINNNATFLIINNDAQAYVGSAFIFQRTGTTWSLDGTIAGTGAVSEEFARSVRVAGEQNIFVISVPNITVSGQTNAGLLQVFQRNNNGYSMIQQLTTTPITANASLGNANAVDIDTSGQWIIAGALGIDTFGTDVGAAFLYTNA